MRFIILDALETLWLASFIQPHFYFRKIEIERAMLESFLAQQRGEFPGNVQPLTQLIARRETLKSRKPVCR